MAEALHSLELLLQCQVCFEEFEEDGDHVPRLLPCTHTACHRCIGRLIRDNKLDCPECRTKHKATNNEKSFPQNKYILTQIRRKSTQEQPKAHEFQKCEKHGKELSLFCLNPECNRPICRSCLKKEHKKHEITEIEDQEKEVLMKEVMEIKVNLEAKVKILATSKMDITKRTDAVVANLKKTKEEIVLRIDKMIKKAEGQNRLENNHIDDELSAINSNIELLNSIQQNIEDEEDMGYEGIMNHRDTVTGISEHNIQNLSGVRSFEYPVLFLDKSSEEYTLGTIRAEEITITLPEPEYLNHEKIRKIPTITNTSQLKCSGIPFCLAEILCSLFGEIHDKQYVNNLFCSDICILFRFSYKYHYH